MFCGKLQQVRSTIKRSNVPGLIVEEEALKMGVLRTLSAQAGTVLKCVMVVAASGSSRPMAAANHGATTDAPPVRITLRQSVADSPSYPLLPLDITIDVWNLTSRPSHCAAFLFSNAIPRIIELQESNRWWIWSPDGTERRIIDVGSPAGTFEVKNWPPCPEIQPGDRDHVRQVLRLVHYQDLWWAKDAQGRPLIEEVFLFPKPGTYVTQLENTFLKVQSNRLTIEVKEPTGRDREAYEYLLRCKWPFFVASDLFNLEESARQEARTFVEQYGDTVYGPYARFYLSHQEYREATNDLATSGVVTNESFLELWDELIADENFRLWPWVLKKKAEYLERLSFRRATRPIVRLGQTLTAEQQKEIALEARVIREFLKKEYPYFPD